MKLIIIALLFICMGCGKKPSTITFQGDAGITPGLIKSARIPIDSTNYKRDYTIFYRDVSGYIITLSSCTLLFDSLRHQIDSLKKRNKFLETHHNTIINHAGDVHIGN